VHRTQEPPSFGEQFTDSGGFQFSKESTTVNGSKVGDVTVKVEFFGNDGVSRDLLEIETRVGLQVTGGEEVLHFATNIGIDFGEDFAEVFF
jgi:hypothetical protein